MLPRRLLTFQVVEHVLVSVCGRDVIADVIAGELWREHGQRQCPDEEARGADDEAQPPGTDPSRVVLVNARIYIHSSTVPRASIGISFEGGVRNFVSRSKLTHTHIRASMGPKHRKSYQRPTNGSGVLGGTASPLPSDKGSG